MSSNDITISLRLLMEQFNILNLYQINIVQNQNLCSESKAV